VCLGRLAGERFYGTIPPVTQRPLALQLCPLHSNPPSTRRRPPVPDDGPTVSNEPCNRIKGPASGCSPEVSARVHTCVRRVARIGGLFCVGGRAAVVRRQCLGAGEHARCDGQKSE
jgi:hypothetical protein